jgi:hypothetical protein
MAGLTSGQETFLARIESNYRMRDGRALAIPWETVGKFRRFGMELYLTRRLHAGFEETVDQIRLALLIFGFRLESELAVNSGQHGPLELPYRIFAVSSPEFEFPGSLAPAPAPRLPLHIVVQQDRDGSTEVNAMDPAKVMLAAFGESHLEEAEQTRARMNRLLDSLVDTKSPVQAA